MNEYDICLGECARPGLARKRSCSLGPRFVLPEREAATLVRALGRQESARYQKKIFSLI